MTVWLSLRKNRWTFWFEGEGVLARLMRWMDVPVSWMHSELVFTIACPRVGGACQWCATRPSPRGYHLISLGTHMVRGITVRVDATYEGEEASHLFVKLPRVSDANTAAFFRDLGDKGFNFKGSILNFLPFFHFKFGVQEDNRVDTVDSVFCSELITAFLQANGYPMGLTPCKTTPQMLVSTLVEKHELVGAQLVLSKHVPHTRAFADRLKPIHAAAKEGV